MPDSNVDNNVDLELYLGQYYIFDESNDLRRVTGNSSIVLGLIRRILTVRGTWQSDENFGSSIRTLFTTKGTNQVTERDLWEIVEEAAAPMIEEQRIKEIKEVKIIKRDSKGIYVDIVVVVQDESTQLNFIIPT
jgi:hypothetical protein